jgi:hypothetical protein
MFSSTKAATHAYLLHHGQELRRHVRQLQVDTDDDYYDDYDDAGPVYSKPGERN